MSDFDQSVFFAASRAAGILKLGTFKMRKGGTVDAWVDWEEPDVQMLPGLQSSARSKQYRVEYQVADLPNLAEGDQVTIWSDAEKTSGIKYRVREAPEVPELAVHGNDGYFRRALLTKL